MLAGHELPAHSRGNGPSLPPDRQLPGEAEEPARGHSGLQPGHGRYGLPGAGDGGVQPRHGLRVAARLHERHQLLREVGGRHDQPHPLQVLHGHGQRAHEARQVRRGRRGLPRGRPGRVEPRSHQGAFEPGRLFHGLEPPGRRRGLLRERPAVRYAAGHAQQVAGEPGAGLCGLRPDGEGGACLRGGHRRQDVLPVRLGQRRLPARRGCRGPGNVRAEPGHPGAAAGRYVGARRGRRRHERLRRGRLRGRRRLRGLLLRRGHLRGRPGELPRLRGRLRERRQRPVLHGHRRRARAVVARFGQAGSQAPQRGFEDPAVLRHRHRAGRRGRRVRLYPGLRLPHGADGDPGAVQRPVRCG